MEDHRSQRLGQAIDARNRQGRHLRDTAQGVALSASLDPKQADGVRLVEVERDLATGDLTQDAKLRRRACCAEHDVIRCLSGQSRGSLRLRWDEACLEPPAWLSSQPRALVQATGVDIASC
jgi:hypothetical protein